MVPRTFYSKGLGKGFYIKGEGRPKYTIKSNKSKHRKYERLSDVDKLVNKLTSAKAKLKYNKIAPDNLQSYLRKLERSRRCARLNAARNYRLRQKLQKIKDNLDSNTLQKDMEFVLNMRIVLYSTIVRRYLNVYAREPLASLCTDGAMAAIDYLQQGYGLRDAILHGASTLRSKVGEVKDLSYEELFDERFKFEEN